MDAIPPAAEASQATPLLAWIIRSYISLLLFMLCLHYYTRISAFPDNALTPQGIFSYHVSCTMRFARYLAERHFPGILAEPVHVSRGLENLPCIRYALAHPGMPLLAMAFRRLTGATWATGYAIVLSAHVVGTYWAILFALTRFAGKYASALKLSVLAFALMVVTPICVPFLPPQLYNFTPGNRSIFMLRNTTHTAAQPYIILSFVLLWELLERLGRDRKAGYALPFLAALTLFMGTIIKLAFTLSFVPALTLFGAACLRGKWDCRKLGICAAVLLPSVLFTGLACYIGSASTLAGPTLSYVLDPLAVWTADSVRPPLSLALALAFPLFTCAARCRQLAGYTSLAWINLLIAIVPYALFRETWPGSDRDFQWIYLYAIQALFICSAVEWLRWKHKAPKPVPAPVATAAWLFVAHTVCGCVRFVLSLMWLY